MSRIRWAIAGALVVVMGLIAGYCYLQRKDLPKEQTKLEAKYEHDTTDLRTIYTEHDSILRGEEPLHRKQGRQIVATERASSKKVIETGEKRIKNLENQLKPGWLKVFGEMDYELPSDAPVLEGTVWGKVGVLVRVRQGTSVQLYRRQPIIRLQDSRPAEGTWNLGIRQEFRIF